MTKPANMNSGVAGLCCSTGFKAFAEKGMGASAPEGKENTVIRFAEAPKPETPDALAPRPFSIRPR